MSIQDVLVTGATGFIGQGLVRFLVGKPDVRVWGVSKNGGQVDQVQVDSLDLMSNAALNAWKKNKPAFSAIFHLAADVPNSFQGSHAEASFSSNVLMTQNVMSLAEKDKMTVIYASSSSVYGSLSKPPFSEDTVVAPDNYYSLGKYVGELVCALESRDNGFSATSLRISAPYGPGQQASTVINIFLKAVLASKDLMLYGSGLRMQDFTYMDDVVQGMWLAYMQKRSGVYNIASGHSVTMKTLAEIIVALEPDNLSKVRFSGKPDLQDNYRGVFPIEKARRELGYQPQVPLEAGLRNCLLARQENG